LMLTRRRWKARELARTVERMLAEAQPATSPPA